jgi:hypothetical protein
MKYSALPASVYTIPINPKIPSIKFLTRLRSHAGGCSRTQPVGRIQSQPERFGSSKRPILSLRHGFEMSFRVIWAAVQWNSGMKLERTTPEATETTWEPSSAKWREAATKLRKK